MWAGRDARLRCCGARAGSGFGIQVRRWSRPGTVVLIPPAPKVGYGLCWQRCWSAQSQLALPQSAAIEAKQRADMRTPFVGQK